MGCVEFVAWMGIYFMRKLSCVAAVLALAMGAAGWGENPPAAQGFFGTATGKVRSAKADGTSFVMTVLSAASDKGHSAVKDTALMVGKDLTLGTRPGPRAEDVAFIKTLKPGMEITVKIFSVKGAPEVLRIMEPGTVKGATTQPTTQQ